MHASLGDDFVGAVQLQLGHVPDRSVQWILVGNTKLGNDHLNIGDWRGNQTVYRCWSDVANTQGSLPQIMGRVGT